ncbi:MULTISPECIES: NAD(P)/FAD-dependent oxidoreductase [unclassified Sphingomonas]|uniref:NAD(P)/FAD-dependent oxidoreductase n=1 Tax=unclassified Sphingomonas TaxID=196159 RepID=UPI0007020801|nr:MULTISPECIES: FAD-dependent oxidoreductase [unclassified Sphingomonas]KQX19475.1 pyridine nucleotide-disulfide oxidoreductase [Sphingomonas sp. Root1294]KQY65676.1 pyridine nucleotide-disulfide oxidoreductase [Sphingomonas sp. Root50]KRB95020.1 pyridine nucleotide-disulfide oxidoreductase [Sphingomonas sp. Root720]
MDKPKIVVLGAGLGGTIAAYEIDAAVKGRAEVLMVSDSDTYSFVPSNPWVAVRWRTPEAIQVHLPPIFARKKIGFTAAGAQRLHASEKRLELNDGTSVNYDYLVIATGPDLAFDEIEGLGPHGGHTVSICQTGHASAAAEAFDRFVEDPGPIVVGAVQGASCYGPAYEFALILDTELRRRKIRDRVPMTFVTAEPYIGHLGLDGVGDTKTLLESTLRERHIKWITNARVAKVEAGMMHVEEISEGGAVARTHDLAFAFSMMLPAFRGVPAVRDIAGLTNPRGFILVDRHQRNPAFPEIFALGVCVAIPPTGPTPVPVGVPKTGFMIESMVTAVAANLGMILDGEEPTAEATWNAVCLADFGDGGVAFVAQPQIPPRNVNWAASGKWVHLAKIGFEKYFLRKVRRGESEPFYEKLALHVLGIRKLRM